MRAYPFCLQTTEASASSHESPQTVSQAPERHTSTIPAPRELSRLNRTETQARLSCHCNNRVNKFIKHKQTTRTKPTNEPLFPKLSLKCPKNPVSKRLELDCLTLALFSGISSVQDLKVICLAELRHHLDVDPLQLRLSLVSRKFPCRVIVPGMSFRIVSGARTFVEALDGGVVGVLGAGSALPHVPPPVPTGGDVRLGATTRHAAQERRLHRHVDATARRHLPATAAWEVQ